MYAKQLLDGELKNVIGDRNMIANEVKDAKSAWDAWGKYCDLRVSPGTFHTFGYDSAHDGYLKYKTTKPAALAHKTEIPKKNAKPKQIAKTIPVKAKIYIVQPGDSLWRIAKDNKTTVDKIKTANSLKSDVIKPGQKLRV